MSSRSFAALLACFLLSGLAALVYQTSFSQALVLALGAPQPAVAAALAATMGGLALGAAVAGRWLTSCRRPLRVYGWLELGVGASALGVPWLIELAGRAQRAIFAAPEADAWRLTLFYLPASLLILALPNALMGATLPLLARGVVRESSELGRRVAFLYAWNTLGAAIGALGGAYLLLPRLGLLGTLHAAVALSFLVAAIAWWLDRAGGEQPVPPRIVGEGMAAGERWGAGAFILPAMLISGAVSFIYEVTWTRLLGHVLGGSLLAFGTMLATYLVGLALGAAAAARWAGTAERARQAFVVAQTSTAAATLLTFAALDRLPAWLEWLAPGAGETHPASALAGAALMLPAALTIGATFPLAVRILCREGGEAGLASARVFTWNTLGAVAGALGAAWILLPALGFAGTITLGIGLNLLLAAAAGALPPRRPGLVVAAVLLVCLVVAWRPATPWNVLRSSPLGGEAPGEPVFLAAGRAATVLVLKNGIDWRLSTDGMPEAAILPPGGRLGRQPTPSWLALLPLAARPAARSVLVIGLGGGTTLEAMPASVGDIKVVEIEPQVLAANRLLAGERRLDPLADPRFAVVLHDARTFLRLTDRKFDVIVSQPSHPWTAGASHLFTREFFALARERLAPDGVLLQWIGLNLVDVETLKTLAATLHEGFDHVEIYCPAPGAAALFLASQRPLGLDAEAAARAVATNPLWRELGVRAYEDLLMARVLESRSRDFFEGAPRNTDHRNLLASRSPWQARRSLKANLAEIEAAWAAYDPLPASPGVDRVYAVARLLEQGALPRARRLAPAIADVVERELAFALIDLVGGRRQKGAEALLRLARENPQKAGPTRAVVRLYQDDLEAGRALPGWLALDSATAAVVAGWQLSRNGKAAAIAPLEPELASIPPRDLLFGAATRLRIAWRQATGDPRHAREGLALLDPLLAERIGPADLRLRAELGRLADDRGIEAVSLSELAELTGTRSP